MPRILIAVIACLLIPGLAQTGAAGGPFSFSKIKWADSPQDVIDKVSARYTAWGLAVPNKYGLRHHIVAIDFKQIQKEEASLKGSPPPTIISIQAPSIDFRAYYNDQKQLMSYQYILEIRLADLINDIRDDLIDEYGRPDIIYARTCNRYGQYLWRTEDQFMIFCYSGNTIYVSIGRYKADPGAAGTARDTK